MTIWNSTWPCCWKELPLRSFETSTTSSTAFADLWSRLEHRFGEVDYCVTPCAALRPDVSRTLSRWSSLSRRYGSSSSPYLFSENNTKNIIGHKQIDTIGRLPEKHKTHSLTASTEKSGRQPQLTNEMLFWSVALRMMWPQWSDHSICACIIEI